MGIACNGFALVCGISMNGGTASCTKKHGARASNHRMNATISKNPLPKLMFTVAETATMLSVSEKTVYRLVKRGVLVTPLEIRTKLITATSIEMLAGVSR